MFAHFHSGGLNTGQIDHGTPFTPARNDQFGGESIMTGNYTSNNSVTHVDSSGTMMSEVSTTFLPHQPTVLHTKEKVLRQATTDNMAAVLLGEALLIGEIPDNFLLHQPVTMPNGEKTSNVEVLLQQVVWRTAVKCSITLLSICLRPGEKVCSMQLLNTTQTGLNKSLTTHH